MNVFLVIVLVLLVLALIYISSKRRKSTKRSTHRARDAQKRHTEKPAAAAPAAAPAKVQTAEAQRKAFLESYPSLMEVSYTALPEGVAPKLLHDLSPDIVETVKEKTASIKPIPVSYLKLMNLLRNPESNPGEITSVTVTNPVFSARVLRAVNSAYYNRPEKITSVGRAISLLGYNSVRALVLQETLNNVIPKEQSGNPDAYNKIWTHSAVVSVCSGHLGKSIFQLSEYELGTMGLFHDLGKYFIHMLTPTGDARAESLLMMQEEERYGINHACLGSLIAANWQLSESISKCIEYHHYPAFFPPEAIPEPYRRQVFVIYLSDLICKALGYTADGEEKLPIRSEYYEMFKMHPDLQDNVAARLIKEIERAHQTVQSYLHTP